jgi:hypothetical protein
MFYVSVVWTRPVKRKVSFMTVHRPFGAPSRGYRRRGEAGFQTVAV